MCTYPKFDYKTKKGMSCSQYIVGEKVKVHPDIIECEKGACVVPQMTKFAGEIVTISARHLISYWIKEDEDHYAWQDFMFLPTTDEADENELISML